MQEQTEYWYGRFVERTGTFGVLLDWDDCAVKTSLDLFGVGFKRYLESIRDKAPEIKKGDLQRRWKQANEFKYRAVGVGRDRWDIAVNYLVEQYPKVDKNYFTDGMEILQTDMYKIIPGWCDGAEAALKLMKQRDQRIVVVSHGDKEWTDYKIDRLGARKYVDDVVAADPKTYRHKLLEHWQKGLQFTGMTPDKAMGAGDNINTDIKLMYQLGIGTITWIKAIWSVYGEGELPEGVATFKNLGRWIEDLAECERQHNGVS